MIKSLEYFNKYKGHIKKSEMPFATYSFDIAEGGNIDIWAYVGGLCKIRLDLGCSSLNYLYQMTNIEMLAGGFMLADKFVPIKYYI